MRQPQDRHQSHGHAGVWLRAAVTSRATQCMCPSPFLALQSSQDKYNAAKAKGNVEGMKQALFEVDETQVGLSCYSAQQACQLFPAPSERSRGCLQASECISRGLINRVAAAWGRWPCFPALACVLLSMRPASS